LATLADRISRLESLLDTGAESVTVDGVTTRVNLEEVRRRLRELYRQQDQRDQALTIRLSGGWPQT
jgi:hypothetical protein